MSQFDDEIRAASRQLAREPMPDGLLDESFETDERRPRTFMLVGMSLAAIGLVLAVGWLAGRFGPQLPAGGSIAPSSSAPAATCGDLPAIDARSTEYRVFFPCADGSGLGSAARTGPAMTDDERLASAIRDLLDGPNAEEAGAGMAPVAPAGSGGWLVSVVLQSDGLAVVDLSGDAAGAGLERVFLDAVRATALDQLAVTAVELRLAGKCEQLFALFGRPCDHLAEPLALSTDCPVVTPGGLPQGDSVMMGSTAPRPHPVEPNVVSWGSGEDTVTERIGSRGDDRFALEGETMALPSLDGVTSADRPEFEWVANGCPYLVTMPATSGRGGAFAQDYSTLFADATPGEPSATPVPTAPYGTASVESDGIRITLSLDRTETSLGARVWAEVTVENIGPDVVHWGHSSSCDWPAGVHLTTDAEPPEYGAKWPGEAGVLKGITVDDPDQLRYGFVPEAAVDFEGNWGCTSDLVPDEILPGERLSARFAWDTIGTNGMPPPGGRYVAESVFGYQGRGDVPADADPFGKQVGAQVSLDVQGPDQDYLAPGEALDLLLSDATFIQLLADNPRTQWNRSTLRWVDESWHLVIEQETPHGSIVGTVDAISGEVSDVRVEPR
ncbi:MAG TPA: GerMN domain-containing protein [Candidatus Limnocylindria bacterium]